MAGKKDLRTATSNGDFRKHLERGIFRRHVGGAYFDFLNGGHSELDAMRGAVGAAAVSLLSNRGARELRGLDQRRIAAKAWERVQPHVKILIEIRDFERRRDNVVGEVVREVARAADELREDSALPAVVNR